MKPEAELKLVLFDLGGVLWELKDPIATFGLNCGHDEFHRNWLLSPAVREFERGAITANEFACNVTKEMQLPYDAESFIERFIDWPGSAFPESIALVGRIAAHFKCAVLSNTNALHWHSFDVANVFGHRFSRYFLSYETGLLKPDPHAFTNVIEQCDCSPQQILFLDDNPLNIAAAGALGMDAVLCQTVAALANVLNSRKLLES